MLLFLCGFELKCPFALENAGEVIVLGWCLQAVQYTGTNVPAPLALAGFIAFLI